MSNKDFKFSQKRPPWMSDDLIELMKNCDIALNRYKTTKTVEDRNIMKYYRNLVNISVKKARNEFVKSQLDIYKNDAKTFWKHIGDILPSKGNTQNFDNILDEEDKQMPVEDLPDFINTYFATVGTKLDKQIPNKTECRSKLYD